MAIDFIIDFPCELKSKLSTAGLLQLLKQRGRARELQAILTAEGMGEADAQQHVVGFHYMTADGLGERRETTVAELAAEAAPLAELVHLCRDCQASRGRECGCCDAINYPLSAAGENWLASIVDSALSEGLPRAMLLEFMVEENLSGLGFSALRTNQRGVFFEAASSPSFAWPAAGHDQRNFTLDDLYMALFGVSRMARAHQVGVCYLSGGLQVQAARPAPTEYQQACAMAAEDGAKSWWVFSLPAREGADGTVRGFQRFFGACFCAFTLGVDLLVDY